MSRGKRYKTEEIIQILREVEIYTGKGQTAEQAIRSCGISEQTYYRWRKKYGGLMPSEMKRLKQLEEENMRLKRLVADLSLDKEMLQEVVKKKL